MRNEFEKGMKKLSDAQEKVRYSFAKAILPTVLILGGLVVGFSLLTGTFDKAFAEEVQIPMLETTDGSMEAYEAAKRVYLEQKERAKKGNDNKEVKFASTTK